jgi:hypothetical protein
MNGMVPECLIPSAREANVAIIISGFPSLSALFIFNISKWLGNFIKQQTYSHQQQPYILNREYKQFISSVIPCIPAMTLNMSPTNCSFPLFSQLVQPSPQILILHGRSRTSFPPIPLPLPNILCQPLTLTPHIPTYL